MKQLMKLRNPGRLFYRSLRNRVLKCICLFKKSTITFLKKYKWNRSFISSFPFWQQKWVMKKKRIASSSFWLLYLKEFWERLSCAFNTFPNFSIICTSSWTSYRCHSLGAPAIVQEEQFAIVYDKLNTWGRWHFEQNWHCTDCSSVQRQIMGSECHSMILLHFSSN